METTKTRSIGSNTDGRSTITPIKAIVRDRYGSAEGLQLRNLEIPEPLENQVLLKVHAAGLDRGVWHLMTGRPYLVRLAGYGVGRPKNIKLGTDVAGVVQAVGKNVTAFRVGDRVFGECDGSLAEYAVARADKLSSMPSSATFEQAAAVPGSGLTALQALRDHGRVQAGQRVLVIGASGGVGTFAVQLARAFGAVVTGVCSTAKAELVRSIGAEEVVDYTRTDLTHTDKRFDLILDIAGNRPLSKLRRLLTQTGTLVIVGGEGGDPWTGGMQRQLRAMLPSFTQQRLVAFITNGNSSDLRTLAGLMDTLKLSPVIDRVCSLPEVPQAMRDLEAGRVRGKVVVSISSPA